MDGTIDNAVCAASGGSYDLAVSIRDANGETQTLEFTEAWHRSDDKTVEFTSDYEIGENVDLLRVRSRRIRCECAE